MARDLARPGVDPASLKPGPNPINLHVLALLGDRGPPQGLRPRQVTTAGQSQDFPSSIKSDRGSPIYAQNSRDLPLLTGAAALPIFLIPRRGTETVSLNRGRASGTADASGQDTAARRPHSRPVTRP